VTGSAIAAAPGGSTVAISNVVTIGNDHGDMSHTFRK
jgi:hypothetical protein